MVKTWFTGTHRELKAPTPNQKTKTTKSTIAPDYMTHQLTVEPKPSKDNLHYRNTSPNGYNNHHRLIQVKENYVFNI